MSYLEPMGIINQRTFGLAKKAGLPLRTAYAVSIVDYVKAQPHRSLTYSKAAETARGFLKYRREHMAGLPADVWPSALKIETKITTEAGAEYAVANKLLRDSNFRSESETAYRKLLPQIRADRRINGPQNWERRYSRKARRRICAFAFGK